MDSEPTIDLLSAALSEDRRALILGQLSQNLDKSGSTWVMDAGQSQGVRSAGGVVASVGGRLYLSTERHGQAEAYLANWVRSHSRQIGEPVPLIGGGLNEEQTVAAKILLRSPIACLSGLPGTGKTYTLRSVIESCAARGLLILSCAPTGSAAARLAECTGLESCTIHRLLGFNGRSFAVPSLTCDVLIVDECSMASPGLLLSLLSRVGSGCRVILVGDPDQLPSVSPGEAFRDLCSVLPHARLTQVQRTESDSPIGRAAADVLAGKVPVSDASPSGRGGFWLSECDSLSIPPSGKRPKNHPLSIAEHCAQMDRTDLMDVRTMAHSNSAVDNLNSLFTENRRRHVRTEKVPVICLKNKHDIGIYNGDVGFIVSSGIRPYLRFGNINTVLRPSDWKIAWASTVHKMQGKESASAQFWLERSANRRVLYTAITRARVRFVITGNLTLLEEIVRRVEQPRLTLLKEFFDGRATLINEGT